MNSKQAQQTIRDALRAQLTALEHMRRDYTQLYSPNSYQVRETDRQILEVRAELKRASSPQQFDKEKERRKAFEAAMLRLVQERNSLLHTSPHSAGIAALNAQIYRLRKDEFSDTYTRAEAELLSS